MTQTEPETGSDDDWTNLFRPGRFALMLGLLVAVSFPDVIFGLGTFILRDFAAFGYPLAHYQRESFWNGELPFWNPLNHCGVPFLAQWNTMTLYPPALFYLLFPLEWSLSWFCLLHLYAGGLGAYFLVRRWTGNSYAAAVAGVAYAFNGLLLNSLMWPNNIAALGLLPWLVMTVEIAIMAGRRTVLIAALIGTLQMLTGAPEVILLGWMTAVATSLTAVITGRKKRDIGSDLPRALGRLAGVIGLVAVLSAGQLLPFFDWYLFANRSAEMDSSGWAATPFFWANFLLPWFDSTRSLTGLYTQVSQAWSHSFYPGIGLLVLLPIAWLRDERGRLLTLSLTGLACAGLAMGETGLLYRWLGWVLPLGEMRFPVKFLIPLSLILPCLAAVGVTALLGENGGRRGVAWLRSSAITLIALTGLAYWLGVELMGQGEDRGFNRNSMTRVVVLLVSTGLLYVILSKQKTIAALCLLLVLWADLRWHSPGMIPTTSAEVWSRADAIAEKMSPRPRFPNGRLFLTPAARQHLSISRSESEAGVAEMMQDTFLANANLIAGAAKCYGFYSMAPPTATLMMRTAVKDMATVHDPMADFMGVVQAGVYHFDFQWWNRPNAMPLVTAGQKPLFGGETNLLKAMNSDRFDPRALVLFPAGEEDTISGGAVTGAVVKDLVVEAHLIRFNVTSPGPALAVVAQSYHPNWQAAVNGGSTPVLRANVGFQAVNLKAGENVVELRYVDSDFRQGICLTAVGLLMVGLLWWMWRPQPVLSQPSPEE